MVYYILDLVYDILRRILSKNHLVAPQFCHFCESLYQVSA